MTTAERVREVVAESLSVDSGKIKPETRFDDLGADSMDMAQLVLDLEDAFGVEIPDKDVHLFKTVQDVVNYADSVKA